MSDLFVESKDTERRVGDAELPLAIGGPDAALTALGVEAAQPLAWLGVDHGDPFVQPADGPAAVALNGEPVETSRWLHDGDVLRVGGTEIAIARQGEATRLRIAAASDDATAPPVVVAEPAVDSSDEPRTVRAVEFRPRAMTARKSGRRRAHPALLLGWLAVVALAVAAWFVFTARSIAIQFDPEPDTVTLVGDLPSIALSDRRLMRPGTYTVTASKAGYHPLEDSFEVTGDRDQAFTFALRKLPGKLRVASSPSGATLSIDGEPAGSTPLAGRELEPGEHVLRLTADRYLEQVLTVAIEGRGVEQDVTVDLAPGWSDVSVASSPDGAAVLIDGDPAGSTPLSAELMAGRHQIELRRDGFRPRQRTIQVEAGVAMTLSEDLQQADGRLRVRSSPPGATVSIDGAYRGETPLGVELAPGQDVTVRLSLTGHESAERTLRLAADERRTLEVALAAFLGEVHVDASPPDATLVVDGEERGPASQVLRLSAAPHTIEVRKDGFEPYATRLTPKPGFPQSVRVTLKSLAQVKAEKTPTLFTTPSGHGLRLLQPGRFQMGASRREPGRRSNESLRQIELTRKFYIGTHEVSNSKFRAFAAEHSSGRVGERSLDGDTQPAVRVGWQQAAAFCNWLSLAEGLPPAYVERDGALVAASPMTTGYRLPTEAEWAWAARFSDGDEALRYPWGPSLPVPPKSGNYADQRAADVVGAVVRGYDDGHAVTAPVGSFPASSLDLHDIGGNAAEWTHDRYTIYRSSNRGVSRDPFGPDTGKHHVIRGSSWMHATVTELRLSYRDYGAQARPDVGFRIARYVE